MEQIIQLSTASRWRPQVVTSDRYILEDEIDTNGVTSDSATAESSSSVVRSGLGVDGDHDEPGGDSDLNVDSYENLEDLIDFE